MEKKITFTCSICDKVYENPMDRAKCELACCKKLEEENKKAAELKKKEEQMASEAKVTAAFDYAYKLHDEHVAKYGSYFYARKEPVTNKPINRDWLNASVGDVFKIFMD